MSSVAELEQALLADPFNAALRHAYAARLAAASEHDAAARQYRLLLQQTPTDGRAAVGAARALLAGGQNDAAVEQYEAGRPLADFAPDPELEELVAQQRRVHPVKLSVVGGSASHSATITGHDNVIPLERARQQHIGFADVAGLADLKRSIRLQIIEPFLKPGLFAKFRKQAGGGVLLYGPPGCGKTMVARAVATECRAEFISIGISDILNMYIGESERNLAAMFDKARAAKPCVLFFDELDALAYARSKATSEHSRQVVNEFLAQLDGFGANNQGVLILAATNMPWDVDSAMKRPGRFTRVVFVPPPDEEARATIVMLKLDGVPNEDIDPALIAKITPHFSGADIEGIVETAKEYAIEDHIARNIDRPIRQEDLVRAVGSTRASTLDWLRTARNLVKYAGADDAYRDVEDYLKKHKIQ